MNWTEGDELAWVRMTGGDDELLVATRKGMAIRFSEQDVRVVGRTARGVRAITLEPGDCVVGMSTLREGARVLTVSETGFGRLSPITITACNPAAAKALSTTMWSATAT